MKKYKIELSGSNTIVRHANTLLGISRIIARAQGRVDIIENLPGGKIKAIFANGPAEEARSAIKFLRTGEF